MKPASYNDAGGSLQVVVEQKGGKSTHVLTYHMGKCLINRTRSLL